MFIDTFWQTKINPVLQHTVTQSKDILVSSVADPWHFGVDPDLDPQIHASD